MLAQFADHLVEGLVISCLGLFTFLVRSYFTRIHTDLKDLRGSVDKLSGRFDSLKEDARVTTTALAVTRQEVSAVWRALDGAHKRASDLNGGD